MNSAREVAAFVFCLFAAGFCLARCTACTPAERLNVENAAAVAQYDAALVDCKAKAREARSMEVYDACEFVVSLKFCRASEALRKEWPRCKEVMR